MNEPMVFDFRAPNGREAVRKALRLLSARIGFERASPDPQSFMSAAYEELGLPYDYNVLLFAAAQVEITYFILRWASMEEQLDAIPLTEFAKDPQSAMALIEDVFDSWAGGLGPE
jgi:hypothetical protein